MDALRRFLFHDWKLRLLSFLIAYAAWVLIKNEHRRFGQPWPHESFHPGQV